MKYEFLFGCWLVTLWCRVLDLKDLAKGNTDNNREIVSVVHHETGEPMHIDHPMNTPQMLDAVERYFEAIARDLVNGRHDFKTTVPLDYRSLVHPDYYYESPADKAAAIMDDSELAGSPISTPRIDFNDDALLKVIAIGF